MKDMEADVAARRAKVSALQFDNAGLAAEMTRNVLLQQTEKALAKQPYKNTKRSASKPSSTLTAKQASQHNSAPRTTIQGKRKSEPSVPTGSRPLKKRRTKMAKPTLEDDPWQKSFVDFVSSPVVLIDDETGKRLAPPRKSRQHVMRWLEEAPTDKDLDTLIYQQERRLSGIPVRPGQLHFTKNHQALKTWMAQQRLLYKEFQANSSRPSFERLQIQYRFNLLGMIGALDESFLKKS
jgi:hypothetical protein